MSDNNNKLQKKAPDSLKERSQYVLAFGVIAMMLFAVGFPMFVIAFFGIFAFFLWKTFSTASPNGVREVFEFYLAANDILRDDERRWFGFEVQDVINRGERILQTMNGAPPLVYFTLGALYHKIGDHKSALSHLSYVLENENSDESNYNYPSPELRNYVRVLRKIEREPAEAPQTSAAVRALERARRNRGKALMEESRAVVTQLEAKRLEIAAEEEARRKAENASQNGRKSVFSIVTEAGESESFSENEPQKTRNFANFKSQSVTAPEETVRENGNHAKTEQQQQQDKQDELYNQRKPITEVLRDIYGEK